MPQPIDVWRKYAERQSGWGFDSLEDLITSPDGFGIATATPLQRAICRLVEGKPLGDLAKHEHVRAAVGDVSAVNGIRPKRCTVAAGIRTFKSVLAAALGIYGSQTVDVSHLGPGEIPRYPIVSERKDLAQVIFQHIVGAVRNSSKLRPLLIGEPTSSTLMLRSPSGRPVEITVSAGARAGSTLVARWLIGVVFDEAARLAGSGEGVVNLTDMRSAVMGRILDGGQEIEISSPWAPMGPFYEDVINHHGTPTPDLAVVRARADWLNPYWWTPERAAELLRTEPTAYKTDFLAEFADIEESLIPGLVLEQCRGGYERLEYEAGHEYVAAMDPATRGNAWTMVVADRVGRRKRIVGAWEWQGSPIDPLKPSQVLGEVREILARYRLDWCYTDQFAADALQDIGAAMEPPLHLLIEDWTAKNKTDAFMALRDAMADGLVVIPNAEKLIKDLRLVSKRVTQSGVSIVLPKTPDGRHADFAPAIARALHRWISEDEEQPPEQGTADRLNWEAKRREEAAARQLENKSDETPDWAIGW